MRRDLRDDSGTVLVLTIGLAAVLLLLVAVVVDLSAVVLARRAAAAAADGAAVAAAQQPDRAALAAAGPGEWLPLDPVLVADVVAGYQRDDVDDQPGLLLTAAVEGADVAVVEATRTVRLPLTGWLGVRQVEVRAVARARSPLAP